MLVADPNFAVGRDGDGLRQPNHNRGFFFASRFVIAAHLAAQRIGRQQRVARNGQ